MIEPADIDRPPPNPDLAIRPYPAAWRRTSCAKGEAYEIRPIRPDDAHLYRGFLARTDPEDLRLRFLAPRRNFSEEMALRLTQLDYDREMAFVALTPEGELAGVARLACDPDHVSGEYAHDRALRPEGQGHRPGADADADRLCRRRRARAARGHRAGREPRRCSASSRSLGFVAAPDPDDPRADADRRST